MGESLQGRASYQQHPSPGISPSLGRCDDVGCPSSWAAVEGRHLGRCRKCLMAAEPCNSGVHHHPLFGESPASRHGEASSTHVLPRCRATGSSALPQGKQSQTCPRLHRPALGTRGTKAEQEPLLRLAVSQRWAGRSRSTPWQLHSAYLRASRRWSQGGIYTALAHELPCCIIHTFLAEDKNFSTANVQVFINVETARRSSDLEGALEKEPKSVLCKQILFESCCLAGTMLQVVLWWLLSCCFIWGP